jgi:hypothetical protein
MAGPAAPGRWGADGRPFLWGVVAGALPAVAAAATAHGRAPGYALNSRWLYRLEVGLAFLLGLYALVLILWLAYQGRSLGTIQLPGGPAVELPDPDLDAATGFADFERSTRQRLDTTDESIRLLAEQVAQLRERQQR